MLSGRQGELESLLEAKVGVFLGAYQEMCRDGFPGDASTISLQMELQHFYSVTPSSFSSRNYHIPAHLGGQLWGEVGFTQAEKISGSVRVLRTPRPKTSLCHLRINFHLERKTCLLPTKQEHKCLLFKGVETVESTAGALIRPCLFTLNRS